MIEYLLILPRHPLPTISHECKLKVKKQQCLSYFATTWQRVVTAVYPKVWWCRISIVKNKHLIDWFFTGSLPDLHVIVLPTCIYIDTPSSSFGLLNQRTVCNLQWHLLFNDVTCTSLKICVTGRNYCCTVPLELSPRIERLLSQTEDTATLT